MGTHLGCPDLLKRVREVRPKVHVFGHIHEAYGQKTHEGINFINASSVNELYYPSNEPVVIDMEIDSGTVLY